MAHYEAAWYAFADVAVALAALPAELALGVITNGHGALQRAKLTALGLDSRLPLVIASDELGCAKPEPGIFLEACHRLALAPAEVAYVGDRLDTDALGAARAGLRGIWLSRSGGRPRSDEIATIASLSELASALVSR
jgi:putative hydrolase of the HAD superfamily